MDKATDKYVGTITTKTLEELVNELQEENLITGDEKDEILEKGYVIIGSKDISFTDGLIKSTYTITNSREEINFNKIILEGDIAVEKPGFQSYSIEGISNSKEGNYISTGAVDGKSGNLEIIGDIKNATFKYNLTNFMQGDETFYCKVNIDGQNYYKEIEIIQGNVVSYEEDFEGIIYNGEWMDIEDEQCSGGGAKYSETSGDSITINFKGSGLDIGTLCTNDTGRFTLLLTSIDDENKDILTQYIFTDSK